MAGVLPPLKEITPAMQPNVTEWQRLVYHKVLPLQVEATMSDRDSLDEEIARAEQRFRESLGLDERPPEQAASAPAPKVSIRAALQSPAPASIREQLREGYGPVAKYGTPMSIREALDAAPPLEHSLREDPPPLSSIAAQIGDLPKAKGLPKRRVAAQVREDQTGGANTRTGVFTIAGVIFAGVLLAGALIFLLPVSGYKGPTALHTEAPTQPPTLVPARIVDDQATQTIMLTPTNCSTPARGYTGIFVDAVEATWDVDSNSAQLAACTSYLLNGKRIGNRVGITLENGATVWIAAALVGEPDATATLEPTATPEPPPPPTTPPLICKDSEVNSPPYSGHGHACAYDAQTAATLALQQAQADLSTKYPTPAPFDPTAPTATWVIVRP